MGIVLPNSVALIAGDEGARAALQPLTTFGAHWNVPSEKARVLVCGTSQSDAGFAPESAARRQAASLGIPIACIEDFPGNYRDVPGAPTWILVVESELSAAHYRKRLGSLAPPMATIPPARYDALRASPRNPAASTPPYRVLWAGQPETASCLATLEALRSFLRAPDVALLFRAHPRDPGHAGGAYRGLVAELGSRAIDVTQEPLAQLLRSSIRLVLTQFSSVAIEAGFLGVPSVHVLLPQAGAALLESQKGYRVPMPCAAGASFHVNDTQQLRVLDSALRDDDARNAVLERFDALYHRGEPQAARLAECVAGIMA